MSERLAKIKTIKIGEDTEPFSEHNVIDYDVLYIDGNSFPILSDLTEENRNMKPSMKYDEMLGRFEANGVIFNESELKLCSNTLKEVNYYKLSVFVKYCEKPINYSFVHNLFIFDKYLKKVLLDLLLNIELMIKSKLTNFLVVNYKEFKLREKYGKTPVMEDSLFYLDYSMYKTTDDIKIKKMLSKFSNDIMDKVRKEPSINHHVKYYGGNIPFWVLIEVLTLGEVNYFIDYLDNEIREEWIKDMIPKPFKASLLTEWLKTVQYLRNDCAHGNRLYAKRYNYSPVFHDDDLRMIIGEKNVQLKNKKNGKLNDEEIEKKLNILKEIDNRKHTLFAGMITMKRFFMLMNKESQQHWNDEINNLELKIAETEAKLYYIGFPDNWKKCLLIDTDYTNYDEIW